MILIPPIRIYVSIDETKKSIIKQNIRELEEFLRKELDNKLQIYHEESKIKIKLEDYKIIKKKFCVIDQP